MPQRLRDGMWMSLILEVIMSKSKIEWVVVFKVDKKRAGRLLDGVLHDAMPKVQS